jgi:uncharacterized protein (DUF302 family)
MINTDLAMEVQLDSSYEEALEQVTNALKEQGFGILTRIDVKDTLKEKLDVDFRPYSILGACNPRLANRALSARGDVGLLLPCNVTVEEADDGGVIVRIADPGAMMAVGGFADDADISAVAVEARTLLAKAAAELAGGSGD